MAERGPKTPYWCFTLNNPQLSADDLQDTLKGNGAAYVVFQEEEGKNGTNHFQGYCEFKQRVQLPKLKRILPTAHWEARRGTQEEAIAYCMKSDTRKGGPWETGEKSEQRQGKRNDLLDFIETMKSDGIRKAMENDPVTYVRSYRGLLQYHNTRVIQRDDKPEVTILLGPAGCGKTRTFYDSEEDGVRIATGGGYWFDGYMDHEGVLIDDFDGKRSAWGLGQLLQTIDRYSILVPTKGGFVKWAPKRIYITSNIHPRHWYDYSDREAQYKALERRFTKIIHWDSSNTKQTIVPDTEQWDKWWKGPTTEGDFNFLAPRQINIVNGVFVF